MNEFDIIGILSGTSTGADSVVVGIGDDAACVQVPEDRLLVVTMDTLVCGVHFPRQTSAQDIACKALCVNLSDIAAMGAEPKWYTLSLTLPKFEAEWIRQFADELKILNENYGLTLIGGDTVEGPLAVSITMHGLADEKTIMRRDGACVGDKIYVSGTLGDAAAGLDVIQGSKADLPDCVMRLNRPSPRLQLGKKLAGISDCAIDVSDGLAADLGHILDASACGAILHLESIPLSDELRNYYSEHGGIDWQQVIAGGDDYELCFTVTRQRDKDLREQVKSAGVAVTCIGEITRASGLRLLFEDGGELELDHKGYIHGIK